VIADLNHNGILDMATANKASRDVSVLLDRAGGTFADEVRYPMGGSGPDALLSGDVNGDGHVDLVSVSFDSAAVFVLLGAGDGTFHAPVPGREMLGLVSEAWALRPAPHEDFFGLHRGHGVHVADADPGPAPAFSSRDVLHLSGLLVAHGELEASPEESGEGSASLGAAFAPPSSQGEPPPLADVLVVNGPGFTIDVALSTPGEGGMPRESKDGEGRAAARLPSVGLHKPLVREADALGSGDRPGSGARNERTLLAQSRDEDDVDSPHPPSTLSGPAPGPLLESLEQEEQGSSLDGVPGRALIWQGEPLTDWFFVALLALGHGLSQSRRARQRRLASRRA
jgi:hypothetical protein